MDRRDFLQHGASAVAASGLVLAVGCTTSATPTTSKGGTGASADRRSHLDSGADAVLARVRQQVPNSSELMGKAAGILVFPSVIAAGIGIGGEYGEGVLRVNGTGNNAASGYYSLASVSFGLQLGAQSKAVVFLFMTQDALGKFRSSKGWSAGVDASVALLKVGANGNLEFTPGTPVLAFVLTNAGLMANLTLEGSKITPLQI